MATDCKSVGVTLRWFKSNSLHHFFIGERNVLIKAKIIDAVL